MAECIPVLLTPFKENKDVDISGLKNILDYYYRDGRIKRLWVLGTGAEDMELTFEEKHLIIKTCLEFKNNYFKIFAGCSFSSFKDTISFVKKCNDYNLEAIHYMPNNNLISLDLLYDLYKKISELSSNQVYAYTSANWGKNIPPEFIPRLKSIDNLAGIKFSTSNIVHTELALSYADNDFEVIPAVVKQLLPSLILGCKSFTTVEASVFLNEILQINNFFKIKDFYAARNSQRKLNNLIKKSSLNPSKHNFLRTAEIKSILEHRNICSRFVADGFMQITQSEFEKLKSFK